MTAERMRWYSDALHTVVAGSSSLLSSGPNIHTADSVARDNGLPGRVADGMLSANWISNLLADAYGERYLQGGSLQTRFIRPIFEDEQIEVVVRVTSREETAIVADVACVKADGEVATAGTATVALP